MYRRDYFLKLVQQFTKILEKLIGLKERGEIPQALDLIREAYIDLFNVNREYLMGLPNNVLVEKLEGDHKFKNEQLEVLAKLFFQDAELVNGKEQIDLYAKSLLILEYLNKKQKMYSFEREDLIKEINAKI